MSHLVEKYPKFFALCALAVITSAAYANSLPNSFHFDDLIGIVRNPTIRTLNNIPAFFTDPSTFGLGSARDWRPILQITYALNYVTGGLNPTDFRIFNLAIHVGAAFLVFLIVAEMVRRCPAEIRITHPFAAEWIGVLSGLLFALHTANDQAVNYIWARSSTLAAFFYLAAFYFYLRGPFSATPKRPLPWHLAALFSFFLGVGTKATVVTLPAVLALYEMLFLNPGAQHPIKLFFFEPKRLKKYLPLTALALAYIALRLVLVRQVFIEHSGPPSGAATVPFVTPYSYLLTEFRAWVFYLKLFIWPHPLSIDFSDFGWSRTLWETNVLASLALVSAIVLLAWWARKSWPILSFFVFWFFITLLPESSFVPLADAVVSYRTYLPYVGASVVAILISQIAWHALWDRLPGRWQQLKIRPWFIYGIVVCGILLALAGASIQRNRVWRDDVTLWTDVMARSPNSPRAHMALGVQYLRQRNFAQAEAMFERAIQVAPNISDAYALRGYLKAMRKKNDEALVDFATAIKLDRRSPYPFAYRGDLYNRTGELDKALADFQMAIKLLPSFSDAYFGAAMVYVGKEDAQNATATCRKLTEIAPDDKRGYDCLGSLLIAQNRLEEAVKTYREATARLATDSELWAGLGNAYRKAGMDGEAEKAFIKANELKNRPEQAAP